MQIPHPDPEAAPLLLIQPGEALSYWQPVPANGFVDCLLSAPETPFSMGTQTVAPGCYVREHMHPAQEEVIFILAGQGQALLDGVRREPLRPGTCLLIGRQRLHRFDAAQGTPLTFMWLLMPGGLDTFFARIGRPRLADEAAPAPFPRPENVLQIEAQTVFGPPPGG